MLDQALIRQLAPRADPEYAEALVGNASELSAANLTTPIRLAMFLGQVLHETDDLTIIREATNWKAEQMCRLWPPRFNTVLGRQSIKRCIAAADKEGIPLDQALANLAYSNRSDLGNAGGDDGWAYRGAGMLQGTGRAWFKEAGSAIGFPLEEEPWLMEKGDISLLAALWTWNKRNGINNRLADRGYVVSIGCHINCGSPFMAREPIGHDDRIARTQRVMSTMGLAWPADDELALGARGDRVERLQMRLAELGYHCGAADGVFGPEVARQVAAAKVDYKRDHGGLLEPEEIVGPITLDALGKMRPVQSDSRDLVAGMSFKEQTAEMLDRGSSEVAAGRRAQQFGTGIAGLGIFGGAHKMGVLDAVTYAGNQVTALRLSLVPAIGALQWVMANLFFVALICGGVWMYMSGQDVIKARLKAFLTRANLSK